MNFFQKLFQSSAKVRTEASQTPLFIVGLGNPGQKYINTRHNLGFLALEYLHKEWGGSEWRLEKKFQAEISEVNRDGRKIYFVKPQTFMNNSGESVQIILNFYKAKPENLIVIHDEVDIPFGKIKTTLSSRAAGHNGVKDIIEKLGTQDFRRLRLGVGKPARNATNSVAGGSDNPNISVSDHVLQNFSSEETKELPSLFVEVEKILDNGF